MTETQLQQECFLYFHNRYKHARGRLFRTENSTNRNYKGLGLIKGVSDLQFVSQDGKLIPIELKVNGTRHSSYHLCVQLNWLRTIKACSGLSFFCFSFEHFKQVIDSLMDVEYCEGFLITESENTLAYIDELINGTKLKTVEVNYKKSNFNVDLKSIEI